MPALHDVTLDIAPGECLLVLGPSGGGKSTLALALGGLVPGEFTGTWQGELEVAGLDTRRTARPAIAERVGIVFQESASQLVMEWIDDDVAFGLENRNWPPAVMRARVPAALAEAGLGELGRRRSRSLSGGQQQRLALAGVLAPLPGVLVLDEPTSNLDPAGAVAFFDRVGALIRRRAATIVLIEHRVDLAWPLADRVLALDATGGPIALETPARMLEQHATTLRAAGIWLPGDAGGRTRDSDATGDSDTRGERASAGRTPGTHGGRPLVEAAGLRYGYERRMPVLDGIDLSIDAGERLAVLGRNGSGKTTLARIVVGLLRPDAGTVRLAGDAPHRLPASSLVARAGYVFQEPELQFLTDRVRDEIAVGLPPAERPMAEALVERLGLPLGRLADASPYTLSGGEKRRLSVASSLIRRPALLVLDEPTFGQDRHGFEALLALLRERVTQGAAIVAITHDLGFATCLSERAVVLDDGRVAVDGPIRILTGDLPTLRRHGLAA